MNQQAKFAIKSLVLDPRHTLEDELTIVLKRYGLFTDGVVRGGAYDEGPWVARRAWRNGIRPTWRAVDIGFRVACNAR
jgi:hypothetical protein